MPGNRLISYLPMPGNRFEPLTFSLVFCESNCDSVICLEFNLVQNEWQECYHDRICFDVTRVKRLRDSFLCVYFWVINLSITDKW